MEKRNLKNVKDIYLIQDISLNDDEQSLFELHNRYKNMYYKQAHKFKNFFSINNIDLEEILNDSFFMVYDSAKTFSADKNIKYITWLGSKSKFYFLNKSSNKDKSYSLLDFKETEKELDDLSGKSDASGFTQIVNYNEIMTALKDHPDKRIEKIFKKRYCPSSRKAPTWRNISKDFNLSSQTIINLHTKGINFLRKKVKNFT